MSDREIKGLKQILEECLKTTVLEYSLGDFTKAGDNYGSILQSLVVTVADANGNKRKVHHLVTKSAISNPYLVALFQPSRTFVKEVQFYTSIIPAIERFEVDSNIEPGDRLDIFIKCFGSRVSLDLNTNVADADALLILEDLRMLNYANEDRQIGFDLQTTFLILSSLARFHALCIALRRSRPQEFNQHIAPHLPTINLFAADEERRMNKAVRRDLKLVDDIDDEYLAKVLAQVAECDNYDRDTNVTEDTPYTTVVHRDLWTNNIMMLKDENGITRKIRVYDFQFYFYYSFVIDLLHFLMTSVRTEALEGNFRIFIDHYHEHFVKTLKCVNYPIIDYTSDKMWTEIRANAKMGLFYSLFITTLVLKEETETTPNEEIAEGTFSPEKRPPDSVLKRWKLILDIYRDNNLL